MQRTIIPDSWHTTAERTPTGAVVIRQFGDSGGGDPQLIIIPPTFVKAFCQGIFDVARQVAT